MFHPSLVSPRGDRPSRGHPGRASLALRRLLATAVVFGAGCESLPPGGEPDPISPVKAQAAFKIDDEAFARLGYRRDWTSVPYVGEGLGVRYIQPFDDAVLVQDGSSTITLLEASNGKRRWHNTIANRLTQFVGMIRTGDTVRTCSQSEVFTLDLTTGQLSGREKIEKLVSTAPVFAGGLFIFGTGTGQVRAHAVGRGLPAWSNATEGAIRVDPVLIGSTVGLVSNEGRILFVDAVSGSQVGTAAIYEGAVVNPAASDSLMFIASTDQSLYAFAPGSPRPIWRKRTNAPLNYPPFYREGVVYCTIPEQGLTAFVSDTGDEKWSLPDVRGNVVAKRAGRLIAWTGTEAVTIDPQSGDVFDRVTLKGVLRLVPDAFEDGNLYAVSDLGVVVKFRPR